MLPLIARRWWVVLIRGLCGVAFGILAFGWPGITLASLVLVYGVYAFADGISAIALGVTGARRGAPWWQMILVGLISLAAGILTFAWPGVTAVALLAVIAAWSIVRGVLEIIAAIRLRTEINNEWLVIIGGACSILFGIILVARPAAGALAVLWIIGTYAIIFGILMIALSFRLHALKTTFPTTGGVGSAATN